MAFLTDRKRAVGRGSAKTGVDHFWSMKVSSIALMILVPLFVFSFGSILGGTYEEVIAAYSRPFPAIVAILTIVVGFMHFKDGARVMIEDYVHGTLGQALIIGVICLSYAAAATGVYAVVKIAL
ncbi:succinate dehydrogenase, hydrophobic membrane anchor protein [Marinovum sp. 2_MG-2023]|uniref:succinate dehydrogenase, hydrophobic membrane anchor protein n=1 Tax=Roseobacteraceae TaxID=2854170 RepID=UPI001FD58A7B|nr:MULTISPECIES: succinate dehydrogenase, hydrophobic membrane anchor protein [Roseobacteraceae]MCJ7871711.1 succinate dehydrogenase, hydrophobic membrane anchor protein [Phaeobacter sp. J2-8]MDO6728545.1 succinate dehydrogenase, hydrophobic membrane anchor protein [Marinovum sp. 2_MG-2023]MDO6778039.1 succinate dehydrogenase, hydrophobic membrane anchor protein [Marinovum sp. 1_MG-2023]